MKPFKCLDCGRVLGYTDGRVLVVGSTAYTFKSARPCSCGVVRVWYPAIDKAEIKTQ
jgi:hypothetical protein